MATATSAYTGTLVAVCHDCHPIRVIDDQGNCGCAPKPAQRRATLCPRKDWQNSCPNPGDPGVLSARHGVTFEIIAQPDGWLSGMVHWNADRGFAQRQQCRAGGRVWATMEYQQNRGSFGRTNAGRCRLELAPPPQALENLTPKEATRIAEAYARLMDDIFANR